MAGYIGNRWVADWREGDHSFNRIYLSRAELISSPLEERFRFEPAESELLNQILAIPGVGQVSARPYLLVVMRGALFTWDEIHPKIMELILAVNAAQCPLASEVTQ